MIKAFFQVESFVFESVFRVPSRSFSWSTQQRRPQVEHRRLMSGYQQRHAAREAGALVSRRARPAAVPTLEQRLLFVWGRRRWEVGGPSRKAS